MWVCACVGMRMCGYVAVSSAKRKRLFEKRNRTDLRFWIAFCERHPIYCTLCNPPFSSMQAQGLLWMPNGQDNTARLLHSMRHPYYLHPMRHPIDKTIQPVYCTLWDTLIICIPWDTLFTRQYSPFPKSWDSKYPSEWKSEWKSESGNCRSRSLIKFENEKKPRTMLSWFWFPF